MKKTDRIFKINNAGIIILCISALIGFFLYNEFSDDIKKLGYGQGFFIKFVIEAVLLLAYAIFWLVGGMLYQTKILVFQLLGLLLFAIGGGIFVHVILFVGLPFVMGMAPFN